MCLLWRITKKWHSMETTSCGNACVAFWIEECTFLSTNHGPSSWKGRFPKVQYKWHLSKVLLQHLAHLENLFKRLREVNIKIHPKKCEFIVTLVVYLRHNFLLNGIMAHWAKIVAILEMPNLIDVHTLKSFIKLCNYYRIYVQDFNTIAHSLYALLKKGVTSTWSEKV